MGILEDFPNIKVIGVTGGTAEKLFKKHLFNLVDQSKVKVVFVPSTSPANAKMSNAELVDKHNEIFQ